MTTGFLADNHGATELDDILDHLYFNREFWYRRVRVYPPPAQKGADNIRAVRDLVTTNDILKAGWVPKVEQYFDNLEEMAEQGKLEECHDVELYAWDGTNNHGFNLWLRHRGSNRLENMHQKM
jgi:hypothetical protein